MRSLRLIRALLSALLGPLRWALGDRTRTTRARTPVFGPSGPWTRTHVAAITTPRARRHTEPPRRPAPVRAPPHILAVLAAAPDIEPDFLKKEALVENPLTQAHPTVLPAADTPKAAETPPPIRRRRLAPRTWIATLTLRLTRGCRAVAEWLVFDSPPPAPEQALMRRPPLATACSATSPRAS